MRGVRTAGAGLALGALGGGLLGLVAGQVMATQPSTATVMMLGAAGGGALWGLFIGGFAGAIAPARPRRRGVWRADAPRVGPAPVRLERRS